MAQLEGVRAIGLVWLVSWWQVASGCYVALAMATLVPVVWAALARVKLHPGGDSFAESTAFSPEAKRRLTQHYSRINGTLVFWKNQATKYRRFHYYVLYWTVPASVLIPMLVQSINEDPWSRALVTIVSVHTALLLSLHKALKIEGSWRAFRHGESEFYDTFRRLLDRPRTFGATEEEQLNKYFDTVENLRKFIRNAETDNLPTVEQATTQLKHERAADPQGPPISPAS